MIVLSIAEDNCKGCGLCVTVCPNGVLAIAKTRLNAKGYPPVEAIQPDKCIGCVSCAKICPDLVFHISKDKSA